jgi:uncharacterized membrane protein YbhN (UPF0104 family)
VNVLLLGASFLMLISVVGLVWVLRQVMSQRGQLYDFFSKLPTELPPVLERWNKGDVRKPLMGVAALYLLIAQFLGALMVFLAIASLTIPINYFMGMFGYAVTILSISISPMFQGIGVAEFSLAYGFRQLELTQTEAVMGTLIFRTFHLWIHWLLVVC